MKTLLTALASASLLVAPLAAGPAYASPQTHGGGGHASFRGAGAPGGGFRGGYRGAGFRGGGFRGGGFRGGGWYGGYPYFWGGALLGFGLGAAFFDPWWYGYPAYAGYYGPYGYADAYPDGPPPAPQAQAQTPQACGSWVWDASQSKYNWVAC